MPDPLRSLDRMLADVAKVAASIESSSAKWIRPSDVQPRIPAIAKLYFESVRATLDTVKSRSGLVEEIDYVVQQLLSFTSARHERGAYRGQLNELRPYLLEAQIDLLKARGAPELVLSQTERAILQTLSRMLAVSAASYEQVLRDIHEGERVSWRGTANELREVLREVIDLLAPDDKVIASSGFALDKGRSGPTQKQKVRYILRARSSRSPTLDVAQESLEATDSAIADLARSTYNRGSVSTHVATDGVEVRRIKRYVDALLAELLEIS